MVNTIRMGIWLLILGLLPGSALCRDMPFGKWWHSPTFSEQLNLTDKEKDALDELYVNSRRKLIDLKSTVEMERLELDTLLQKEELNEDAVNQQFIKLEKARNNLSSEYFKFILESRKILGKERFEALKIKRKMVRQDRHSKKGDFHRKPR